MTLAEYFKDEATKLADVVADIADANTSHTKQKKFLLLLLALRNLQNGFDPLLWIILRDSISRSTARAVAELPDDVQNQAVLTQQQQTNIAQRAHSATK